LTCVFLSCDNCTNHGAAGFSFLCRLDRAGRLLAWIAVETPSANRVMRNEELRFGSFLITVQTVTAVLGRAQATQLRGRQAGREKEKETEAGQSTERRREREGERQAERQTDRENARPVREKGAVICCSSRSAVTGRKTDD
jgi:hypothetical protein